MADVETDPFISTEEVELDSEAAAAIEVGVRAADEGRCLPSEEVRKLVPVWISKFSTQNRP